MEQTDKEQYYDNYIALGLRILKQSKDDGGECRANSLHRLAVERFIRSGRCSGEALEVAMFTVSHCVGVRLRCECKGILKHMRTDTIVEAKDLKINLPTPNDEVRLRLFQCAACGEVWFIPMAREA